jgi:RimJ/RimL family protein N-acetyltransferase
MEMKGRIVFAEAHGTVVGPFDKETDLDAALRWVNDSDIMDLIGSRAMPMTREREAEWFDGQGKSDRQLDLAISVKGSGKLIGGIGLHKIDMANRVAAAGILIGEKKYWGKGHGTNATMLLLKHAFYRLNLHKICWDALGSNTRSIKCAERCGFKVEGTRKDHLFRQGRYVNLIELAAFRPQWEKIYKRWLESGSVK